VRLGVRAALSDGAWVEGDVEVAGGAVAALGLPPAPGGGVAVPGFVDVHINGFGGIDFLDADAEEYARAAAALAATGVVAFQPTFVSSAPEAYAPALRAAAAAAPVLDARGLPRLLGVHLEGPFLSPAWPGAHDPAHLRPPDRALTAELCGLGPVTTMTLAPELPGALDLVADLAAGGVVVSCGHSDADAAAAHAAFDHGARAITHLYNAHRRFQARDPGLGGVALARPDVWVQAIVDGVHLAPETARVAVLAAGRRFVLVTDAIEAAGCPDGEFALGGRAVRVRDGEVRLPDGTLAGSVLSMDQGVRNLVAGGADLADAVHAAAGAPAALLRRPELGDIRVGGPAHIAVLDDAGAVRRTLVGGAEAFAA
jgi:N-acetylglucosamine-6-phosphate deacetylase